MTPAPSRLVLLSAESQSIDAVRGVELPDDLPVIVVCWQTPSAETAEALRPFTVVDLSVQPVSVSERVQGATGIMALAGVLSRSSPGRLLASFGPAHQSRRFAARARRSVWHPQPGDAVIALDLAATRAAWFAQRDTAEVTATFGLGPGLARLG